MFFSRIFFWAFSRYFCQTKITLVRSSLELGEVVVVVVLCRGGPAQVASCADWKFEHRVLSLAKMGFRRQEAEVALRSSSASGDIMAHDTLCRLLEQLRSPALSDEGHTSGDEPVDQSARDEEASVLQAIFGEEAFREIGGEEDPRRVRWEVDTMLEYDGGGIAAETTIGVVFQEGKRSVQFAMNLERDLR